MVANTAAALQGGPCSTPRSLRWERLCPSHRSVPRPHTQRCPGAFPRPELLPWPGCQGRRSWRARPRAGQHFRGQGSGLGKAGVWTRPHSCARSNGQGRGGWRFHVGSKDGLWTLRTGGAGQPERLPWKPAQGLQDGQAGQDKGDSCCRRWPGQPWGALVPHPHDSPHAVQTPGGASEQPACLRAGPLGTQGTGSRAPGLERIYLEPGQDKVRGTFGGVGNIGVVRGHVMGSDTDTHSHWPHPGLTLPSCLPRFSTRPAPPPSPLPHLRWQDPGPSRPGWRLWASLPLRPYPPRFETQVWHLCGLGP